MTIFYGREKQREERLSLSVCEIFVFVSVLKEYNGHRKSGHISHILHIMHILIYYLSASAWLDQCQSAIVYERRETAQVLYVIPVSSILGRLPLVPVGATGTKPFAMRRVPATKQRTVVMVVDGDS